MAVRTDFLGITVSIALSGPPPLARHLRRILGPLSTSPRHPAHLVEVLAVERGDSVVRIDGTEWFRAPTLSSLVGTLLRRLTQLGVERASDRLLVHAGVVGTARGVVVIPGRSGSGKSTLVAALLDAGATYLSDEIAVMPLGATIAQPFPRPMALTAESVSLLETIKLPPTGETQFDESERLLTPDELGAAVGTPGPVIGVVMLEDDGSPTPSACTTETRGAGLIALMRNRMEQPIPPVVAFQGLARAVERSSCIRLGRREPYDMARTVMESFAM